MTLEANIKVGLKIDQEAYDIDVAIPAGVPTPAAPYTFSIAESGDDGADLLNVVVGDSTHFYVAVSPPKQVKDWTGDVVQDLEVVVNDGGYDPETGKFTDNKNPDPKPVDQK